jgi:serine/threonine protein phosphatase PrpC
MSSTSRPPHFAPGTEIGKRYTIEGLVRLAEGRMFYLANDLRRDRPAEGPGRRFLVSARWDEEGFEAFEKFAALALQHPGLASPVDVLRHEGQLLSVVPYGGEGLLLDEAAPFPNARILQLAQRIAGTLAFLHVNGVRVGAIDRANLLISPDNSARLFDLDIVDVSGQPVPDGARSDELRAVGEMLRRYCNVEAEALAQFLHAVAEGKYGSPSLFGRAVESRFDAFEGLSYRHAVGAMTDVGLSRQLNEDNWGWRKLSSRSTLYVVADGMGGHDSGEVASDLAVRTICKVAHQIESQRPPAADGLEKMLNEAFQAANNTIKGEAESRGTDMGTTLVSMLVVDDKYALIANVGDSRAYRMRGGSLQQVTEDHSLVAKYVQSGKITRDEARTHPHSNILLRTVGTERDIDIDIVPVEIQPGDRVLLCSDGLWGDVEDRDLESILNRYDDPRVAARELVRASHSGGGKDNVTLVLVHFNDLQAR